MQELQEEDEPPPLEPLDELLLLPLLLLLEEEEEDDELSPPLTDCVSCEHEPGACQIGQCMRLAGCPQSHSRTPSYPARNRSMTGATVLVTHRHRSHHNGHCVKHGLRVAFCVAAQHRLIVGVGDVELHGRGQVSGRVALDDLVRCHLRGR